jgi:hypothetical protein
VRDTHRRGVRLHCFWVRYSIEPGTAVEVNVKRIVGLLVLALVVFFVISQPTAAANSVDSILSTLRGAAESVTSFFTKVVT